MGDSAFLGVLDTSLRFILHFSAFPFVIRTERGSGVIRSDEEGLLYGLGTELKHLERIQASIRDGTGGTLLELVSWMRRIVVACD